MGCNFGKNLRNELDYQGVTVKELSAKTGIPIASLDCYLGTRATVPAVDTAVKIARTLQVSVEYLVNGEMASTENSLNKTRREAQEIIRWIGSLNSEQCRAILNLVKNFNHQKKFG